MKAELEFLDVMLRYCRGIRRGKRHDLVPAALKWEQKLEMEIAALQEQTPEANHQPQSQPDPVPHSAAA